VRALLSRELRLALRHPADTLSAVLFFVLVAALFPFGVGPSPELLARLAPGALLASALLAALLPLDRLWGADAEDGTLDQLLLSGLHPAGLAAAKALAHWLTTGVPLVLATPVAAALLNLPVEAWGAAALALALGFQDFTNGTATPTTPAAPTAPVRPTRSRRRPTFTPSVLINVHSKRSICARPRNGPRPRAGRRKTGLKKSLRMIMKSPTDNKVETGR